MHKLAIRIFKIKFYLAFYKVMYFEAGYEIIASIYYHFVP